MVRLLSLKIEAIKRAAHSAATFPFLATAARRAATTASSIDLRTCTATAVGLRGWGL